MDEAYQLVEDGAFLLDVRTPEEWADFVELNAEMSAKCEPITEKKDPLC